MRPTALVAALAAFACLGTFSTASACDDGKRTDLVERFDADKDGKLSDSERAAAKTALADRRAKHDAELLAKHPEIDADKNGELSKDQRKSAGDKLRAERQARFKEKHPKAFAKVDTNGDGTIDKDERQAAGAAGKERFLAKHPEADKNQDGELDRCERKAHRKEHGGDKKKQGERQN